MWDGGGARGPWGEVAGCAKPTGNEGLLSICSGRTDGNGAAGGLVADAWFPWLELGRERGRGPACGRGTLEAPLATALVCPATDEGLSASRSVASGEVTLAKGAETCDDDPTRSTINSGDVTNGDVDKSTGLITSSCLGVVVDKELLTSGGLQACAFKSFPLLPALVVGGLPLSAAAIL